MTWSLRLWNAINVPRDRFAVVISASGSGKDCATDHGQNAEPFHIEGRD
jgi:hypothetical protein